jgi:hypothetical protein
LRRDRYRPEGVDNLGLLALLALVAGAISRTFGWLERWATRPVVISELSLGSHRWHKS